MKIVKQWNKEIEVNGLTIKKDVCIIACFDVYTVNIVTIFISNNFPKDIETITEVYHCYENAEEYYNKECQ